MKVKKAPSSQEQLDSFLNEYLPEIADQARVCLKVLRARLPGAVQLVYDNYNALVIGFGPSERASEAIFSLALYPRYLRFFFAQGARVPDPGRLLEGKGSTVRSILLLTPETLNQPEILELMCAAQEIARVPFDHTARGRLVIRSVSAKQRPRRPA